MFDGTGLSEGNMNGVNPAADACRPNSSTIIHYCQNLPPAQPRPEAFTLLAKQYFGMELKEGIKCFDGICKLRDDLAQYDNIAVFVAVALFLSTFLIRCAMNWCIRSIRKGDQKHAADEQKRALAAGRRGRR
jgi:hypothetical protein